MSGDLLIIMPEEQQDIVQIFQEGGCDPLIDKLEAELKTYNIDVTTDAGRKQMASIAYKIAKTKTALDKQGESLIAEKKRQVDLVNKERKRVWARMEKLQHDFRRPLTDYESELKRKQEEIEAKLRAEAAARERELHEAQEVERARQAAEVMQMDPKMVARDIVANELEKREYEAANPPGISFMPIPEAEQAKWQRPLMDANSINTERNEALTLLSSLVEKLETADILYLISKIKAKWFKG